MHYWMKPSSSVSGETSNSFTLESCQIQDKIERGMVNHERESNRRFDEIFYYFYKVFEIVSLILSLCYGALANHDHDRMDGPADASLSGVSIYGRRIGIPNYDGLKRTSVL